MTQISAHVKFANALELRLGIAIETRVSRAGHFSCSLLNICIQEKKTAIPPSLRLLFAALFREIRLLTRTLKA
jgi:hypothetical protein